MSYTKNVTIRCDGDGCTAYIETVQRCVADARYIARTEGWTSHGNYGRTYDYCPICAENFSR